MTWEKLIASHRGVEKTQWTLYLPVEMIDAMWRASEVHGINPQRWALLRLAESLRDAGIEPIFERKVEK